MNDTDIGPEAVPPESKAIAVYVSGTKNINTNDNRYPGTIIYIIENLNNALAIVRILVIVGRIHATHQVGTARIQVIQGVLEWFQLDSVRDVQLLADESQQVDIVTHRFADIVEKSVWPQVPHVLVHQWVLLGIGSSCAIICGKA